MTTDKEEKLMIYHIVFYPDPESNIAHCINIEATNMVYAIRKFYLKFPNIEPLYCHHKK
jgi:hypothetical protein